MTGIHDAAVVGAGDSADCAVFALRDAGVTDVVVVPTDVTSRFDAATDTWLLRTTADVEHRSRFVIAAHGPFHVPVAPNIMGCNDFAGPSFHASTWKLEFDSAGKCVALIGATAPAVAPRLARAARLIVFHPLPSRMTFLERIVRWVSRPKIDSVTAEVERITPTGVRTVDGAEHRVDAIIYATGHEVSETLRDETVLGARGLPLRQAWRDGAVAYRGIAAHGFPNFFLLNGPGAIDDVDTQMHYIVQCFEHMRTTGSSRIEVRLSSQRLFAERGQCDSVASAFEFSCGTADDEDVYDGPAVVVVADQRCHVRVRLTGYLDPIDGKYHWRGTVFDAPPLTSGPVRLEIADRAAQGRITEETPWGSFTIAGVGMPPFPLAAGQPT